MGWPISKQAAYHGLFQNGPNKKLLLIGLTGVKMGWPVLKWAARFKMGQITNRAVTYIHMMPVLCKCLTNYSGSHLSHLEINLV